MTKRLRIQCFTDGSCPVNPGRAHRGEAQSFLIAVAYAPDLLDQCLIWPYSTDRTGRAQVWFQGKMQYVCRIVCALRNGPPPTPAHVAAHSCENGHIGCCNPLHVRWKTVLENNMEGTRRSGGSLRGQNNNSAKLTYKQVAAIRKSKEVQTVLASKYGVCRNTIGNIKRGNNWK